jgi:adenylate kinase
MDISYYYSEKCILVEIYGVGDIDEITRKIKESVGLEG